MQCPACFSEVAPQAAFCGRCGTPMSAAAATPGGFAPDPAPPTSAGYSAVPGSTYPPQPVLAGPSLSPNAAAAIAYITIIPAIVFLVLEPYNRIPLVRFHSWQSIGLGLASIVLQAVLSIAGLMLHFIPFIIILFSLVHLVLGLGLFLVWIFIIVKASRGEWYKLPVIGDFAEKQARS